MGENSDQIEKHIQEQREELADNIGELKKKAKDAVDWRNQFQHRPMTMLGLAFAGGVLLSAALPHSSSRPSPRRGSSTGHSASSAYSGVADSGDARNVRHEYDDVAVGRRWGSIKGALVGVAATTLGKFLKEALPGFDEDYRKTKIGTN